MSIAFQFLTVADPPGTSEGRLDPLGLYQIADSLATQLVTSVRERMLRVRFRTAMAVGALVTERFEADPRQRESLPYLAWEWHVVEAIVRSPDAADARGGTGGVPGIGVTRRAVRQHECRDFRALPRHAEGFWLQRHLQATRHSLRSHRRPPRSQPERRKTCRCLEP